MFISRFVRFTVVLCAFSLLSLAGTAAFAQTFTFSLNPATKPGTAGSSVTFQGTLNNNTSSTVFVNGLSIGNFINPGDVDSALPAAAFTLPQSIAANSTYTGDIFTIQISPTASGNTISGDVTALGGATTSEFGELADPVNFFVAPVIIPETNTLGLLALATPVAGFLAYRRRFRKA